MTTLSAKVVRKHVEALDISSFELVSTDGQALPAFTAGAHIDVHLRGGLIRQYSLCNDPQERHRYLIAALREPLSRGGSVALHDEVACGDVLQISTPRNLFALVPAQRYLLLAGGIGITPIVAMAEQLQRAGADFELHYCTRSAERTAFSERMKASAFASKVHIHHDDGLDNQKLNLAACLSLASPQTSTTQKTHLFVCGPTGFIEYVVNTAQAQGWPAQQVHVEYFGAAAVDASKDRAFDVRLASSGQTFHVPHDQTVVAVLAQHGVDVPVSCEAGICGTCITRILEGTPEHRDVYFTDQEKAKNDQFTPCCSRATSALLVLDL